MAVIFLVSLSHTPTPLITCILWEADGQGAVDDLFFKEILLVEEEDDGGVREPLVVTDAVKQLHALVHPILSQQHTQ